MGSSSESLNKLLKELDAKIVCKKCGKGPKAMKRQGYVGDPRPPRTEELEYLCMRCGEEEGLVK